MITKIHSFYTPAELDRLYKQQWIRRAFLQSEGFRILRSPSPEFRTEDGKFVALLVPNVFTPAEQQRRAKAWATIKGSLGNRASVFPEDARMMTLRKDGKPSGQVGVPEAIAKAMNGEAVTLGYDHKPKRQNGRWVGKVTGDTLRYPKLFTAACVDAARVTEVFRMVLPAEFAKQEAAYGRIHPDWRIAHAVVTSVYGISMPTACHIDRNDHPAGTGIITASGSWQGGEFILPEFKLAFDLKPGDALFVDVHRLHGNLQRTAGHRVAQVYYIRSGMDECVGLDGSESAGEL